MRVIAVTGACGKSGQSFLQCLADHPETVSGFRFRFLLRPSHFAAQKKALTDQLRGVQAEFFSADLDADDSLDGLFRCDDGAAVDTLLHIAGVNWTPKLAPAALSAGVQRMILVHTSGIYSKYKAAGETYRQIEADLARMAEGHDVSISILRPTMIYGTLSDGNLSVFLRMTDKLRLLPVINGARYALQPVWCKDLGVAYYQILLHPEQTDGKDYILSGGAPIELREIFCELGRQLGVRNHFVSCPYPIAITGAWGLYLLSFGRKDFREKVQRMVEPRAYPHDAATRDFGYDPAVFPLGIRDEVAQYKRAKQEAARKR